MRLVYRFSDAVKEFVLVLWLWLPLGFLIRHQRTVPVIASLTTYPPRIARSWLAIETLLRQSAKPRHLVLVLNTEEFPSKELPPRIHRQTKRGLEVLWVPRNGRSHDKLIPVRAAYPKEIIVTFDDDKFFPRNLLNDLVTASERHPRHIVGARGWVIRRDGKGTDIHFGQGWTRATPGMVGSYLLTPGGNGCLYPPGSLSSMVDDLDAALSICPAADDIWFWGAIQKNSSPILCLGMPPHRPVSLLKGGPALSSIEPFKEDLQFQRALDHYGIRDQILKASKPAMING